jgi:carboxylesterase
MPFDLYPLADHTPYRLDAGRDVGALLINGFTGTPRGMRPLADALQAAGVTSVVPQLPGFGPDRARLGQVSWRDWMTTARAAWDGLQVEFGERVLLGYSMGGAVALRLAEELQPDRLILVAPYWKANDWREPLIPLLRFAMPQVPFGPAGDFTDPAVRDHYASWRPELDLDDPEVQEALRADALVPSHAINELKKLAGGGSARARRISAPALVVQGERDDVVPARLTRQLLAGYGGPLAWRALPGDHFPLREISPDWLTARDEIVAFASGARVDARV